jgi:hypothetical protein
VEQPEAVKALIERVFDDGSLLRSSYLGEYLAACQRVGEYERVENLLADVVSRSVALEDDVRIAQLMFLRHQGRTTEADALEAELVAACRTPNFSPVRVNPRLRFDVSRGARSYQSYRSYNRWSAYSSSSADEWDWIWGGRGGDITVADAARALGVRYDDEGQHEELTLTRLVSSYARHGLGAHAARLTRLVLDQCEGVVPRRETLNREIYIAKELATAGDTEQARQRCESVRKFLEAEAAKPGVDAALHLILVDLYSSEAYGPDYDLALQSLRAAKRVDTGVDASGEREAGLLFELERFGEAWELYAGLLRRGEFSSPSAGKLYRIGLAAARAGDIEAGRDLLRLALWFDPQHARADEARELIHEQPKETAARAG